MRVFICTRFKGHNPVGVSAVITARDATQAAHLLNFQLAVQCLNQTRPMTAADVIEVNLLVATAYIIQDGDY